ncbi:hypothetical protein [Plasmodium yoelii yoelii]|uniref:Uncharacterized protein n=1 Tax=Plasmodium yoelii yoelii TaxID=73239 RepID=Q7RDT6_PLAYO|nr:hypothetical protein [Plasmodium yoelii yoelii]
MRKQDKRVKDERYGSPFQALNLLREVTQTMQ